MNSHGQKPSPTPEDWTDLSFQVARGIRRQVLRHVLDNNGGYLSQACSSAEILATLYTKIMHLGPSQGPLIPVPFSGVPGPRCKNQVHGGVYNGPKGRDLDKFFFSPVHYSLVLYATLVEVGRLSPEGLQQFNKDGSTVEMIGAEHSPGIESTAGSLGQAISQAGGVALGRKIKTETGRVWVFMSDGEFQEGQTWEAFAAASFHNLDNLGVYVDVNKQQCDGHMDSVMTVDPLDERLKSFGAHVLRIDGHDPRALAEAASDRKPGKPSVVLCETDPCRGIDVLRARTPKLHYVRFKDETERYAYEEVFRVL